MSRLEIFLVIIVVATLGWLGTGMFRAKHADMCTPLPLSQEVKAYIDSKISASGSGQCSELPKLVAKIADLQVKIGGIELYRLNKTQKDQKTAELADTSAQLRKKWQETLNNQRFAEVGRIKSDIAGLCSGTGTGAGNKLGARGRMVPGGGGQKAGPVGIPGPEDDKETKPAAGSGSDGL